MKNSTLAKLIAPFLFALFVAAEQRVLAQCGTWTPDFAVPPVDENPRCAVAFDKGDGAGEQLYLGIGVVLDPPTPNEEPDTARVVRWTGRAFESVYDSGPVVAGVRRRITDLAVAVDGATQTLYAVERLDGDGLPLRWIARKWDGAVWSEIGTFNNTVRLADVDDGAGAVLVAGGTFTAVDGVPCNHVARWNGSTWSAYGSGIPQPVFAFGSFDDGGGVRLYAGVTGGTPAVRRWDGASWVAVGTLSGGVDGFAVFDSGSGARLYAGGQLSNDVVSNRALMVLTDGAWVAAATTTAFASSLVVADIGVGQRIFFCRSTTLGSVLAYDGTTVAPLGALAGTPTDLVVLHGAGGARLWAAAAAGLGTVTRTFGSLASWDGAAWQPLGSGLNAGDVRAFATFDAGGGNALYATGTKLFTPDSDPSGGHVQRWNGDTWTKLSPDLGNTANALAVADIGGATSLFAAGTFQQVNDGATSAARIARWTGAAWAPLGGGLSGPANVLLGFDDGSGPKLVVGGAFVLASGVSASNVAAWDGASWSALGAGLDLPVTAFAAYDTGNGAELYAGGVFTASAGTAMARVARWDGSAWHALGGGVDASVNALCVFGDELWAGGTFTDAGGVAVSHLARWNGSAWSDVPGGGADGGVVALHVHDDGRGPALYVGGAFSAIGGITAYDLARFDGVHWEAVDGGVDGLVRALTSFDDDGDGDDELFAAGAFTATATASSGGIARLEGCPHSTSFCFGDGSFGDHTTPCPCGNDGAPGRGCANSVESAGAQLGLTGAPLVDDLTLHSGGTPGACFTLFLQHDAAGDAVFHDGVLCASGNMVRLRGRAASAGQASFPNSTFPNDATLTLSQRGGVVPGGGAHRSYVAWYRNAASTFCPPATANATNGVRVVW